MKQNINFKHDATTSKIKITHSMMPINKINYKSSNILHYIKHRITCVFQITIKKNTITIYI